MINSRFGIHSNMNILNVSLSEVQIIDQKIKTISSYIAKAKSISDPNLKQERRRIYGLALTEIVEVAREKGSLPKELLLLFYELLHCYAKGVRYAQDGQNGFKDCAKLMRLSFNLQCRDLGLIDFDFKMEDSNSFEDLIANNNYFSDPQQFDRGIFHDESLISSIKKALENNESKREIFGDTMILLSFFHQNLAPMSENDQNFAFQKLLNQITLMVGLKYVDPQCKECQIEQILSYHFIEELYNQKLGVDSLVYKDKLSQIENRRGILVTQIEDYENDAALGHFRRAIDLRSQIPVSDVVEEKWNHDLLLNDIRRGLINELTLMPTAENIQEAFEHAHSMALFIIKNKDENRDHSYSGSYMWALAKLMFLQNLSLEKTDDIKNAFKIVASRNFK